MAKQQREEYDVTVLSRREITVFPKVGQKLPQILVTYIAAGLPPTTLTIDKSKYTVDAEKRLIRADIERRLKEKPESFKV